MRGNIYNTAEAVRLILHQSADTTPERVAIFFKTGVGDYAEQDQFIGIKASTLRKIAKDCIGLPLNQVESLLHSKFNEERLIALIILTMQYQKLVSKRGEIYQFYLKHLHWVNNWNLVDASAHLILGAHLWDKERNILFDLARSNILWKRRISIVATLYFIKRQDFEYTIKIATALLDDDHDLIHKAVGWMLREVGKQELSTLTDFLEKHLKKMARTMLRYAIERLAESQRKDYLLRK